MSTASPARSASHYTRAEHGLSVTVPFRSYVVMADVLAAARAAEDIGHAAGASADLETALRNAGYEPALTTTGDIELRNCLFHQLMATHTEIVCGLNKSPITGVLEGVGDLDGRAELIPQEGRCCVVIHPEARPAGTP